MNSSFFISFRKFFSISIFIFIFLIIIFIPIVKSYPNINFYSNDNSMIWPIPGYNTITSPFGYRNAPATGSSSYHSGIDIGAPSESDLVACFSGVITYTGFSRSKWIQHLFRK